MNRFRPGRGDVGPRWFRLLIIASCGLLVAVSPGMAQKRGSPPADVHFLGEDGQVRRGVRCATPKVGRGEQEAVRKEVAAHLEKFGIRLPSGPIPVAFHVVYARSENSGELEGHVPGRQLHDQIDVLNAAYEGTGFEFYLAHHEYVESNRWFRGCWGGERQMKEALAIDPVTTLNIYTCGPRNGILGWSYLPWSLPEDSLYHGVVALYSSLPGGSAAPYNEGDTITHEVGHYLGLLHTFQNGCEAPGDEVDDTPYEATAAFGCPLGRDTCEDLPGLDPVENFMDYTDDACMIEFTPIQGTRMREMVSVYKPGL